MNEFPKIPGHKILKKLGQGGMADVYLGVQEKLDRQVAIKVLSPHLFRDEQFSTRFVKEAQTAAKLTHPNIITIHDVGDAREAGGNHIYYIVMEFLAESLSAMIRRRGLLPAGESLTIIKMIASALDYAHQQGFIHRDIKPDNIMFRTDGAVVLVDFGIARAINSTTHLTRTGMSIGTPHYMSPEQCMGEKIDGRSDLYSLGVQLFELLTGDVPYRAENTAGVIIKHIQEPIPRLPEPLIRFQPLIERLMAKKRDERPANGKEVIALIESLCGDLLYPGANGVSPTVPASEAVTIESAPVRTPSPHFPTTARTTMPKQKKGPLAAALMILFGIIVIAGGFILLNQGGDDANGKKPPVEKRLGTDTPGDNNQTGKNNGPGENSQKNGNGTTVPAKNTDPGKTGPAVTKDGTTVTKTPPVDAVDKEKFRRDVEYDTYFEQANKDYKNGDYNRALQSVAEAAKRKKTRELDALEKKIRRDRLARKQKDKEKEQKQTGPGPTADKKTGPGDKPAVKDVISALQLKTELRVKYSAILKRLTIPLIRRNIRIHGFVTVTLNIGKDGRIAVQDIRDDSLNVRAERAKEFFRKIIRRKLSNIPLEPPRDKNGNTASLAGWRITYKVGKFRNSIVLTKQ